MKSDPQTIIDDLDELLPRLTALAIYQKDMVNEYQRCIRRTNDSQSIDLFHVNISSRFVSQV
jgi:hypothetical protein